jgi:ribosome-associated toxin RatA of RatAB toxin-antitoxin module
MNECTNEIRIRAPLEQVMALAFDLPRWPSFLPHYRWVTILAQEGERKTVEMACWRTGIPLRWRSYLWVLPDERRMRFEHIAGPARGMKVEWTLEPAGDEIRVEIRHDLALETPIIRSALGRWIVGELFVGAVAGRTLACLKKAAEAAE